MCMLNIGYNVAVTQHFGQRNDIAFSVVQLGFNLGGILTIQLHSWFVKEYGIRGSMLLTGAIFFHVCAAGVVLAPQISTQSSRSDNRVIFERKMNT